MLRSRLLLSFLVVSTISLTGTVAARADAPPDAPAEVAAADGTAANDAAAAVTSLPNGNLDGWRQIFRDDFDDAVPLGSFPAAVRSQWSAYPSPWGDTTGYGTYDPQSTVSIANGVLTAHIHTEGTTPMVTALLPQLQKPMLYGRYSVRFRFDPLPGYKIAWLLWPDSNDNRRDGEVDFPEMDLDSSTVWAFDHRTSAVGEDQAWFNAPLVPGTWHTTTIEWTPGLVVFLLDGLEIGRTTERTPHVPMHWVLQTETALDLKAPPSPSVRGDVDIAWVTAYAYEPSVRAPLPERYVRLVAPSVVDGTATLGITASAGMQQAKWVINGEEVAWDPTPPYTTSWNSNHLPNGIYPIYAKFRDAVGWIDSPVQSITVDNERSDLSAPSSASGDVTLRMSVSPWVSQVKWVVDGVEVGSTSEAPWSTVWDSRTVANGAHTIFGKSVDLDGWYDGPPQTINVAN